MAFVNPIVKQTFAGDNTTTSFAIPFQVIIAAATEVKVYIRDLTADPITQTLKAISTDYTIDSGEENVIFNVAPTTDEEVVLTRELPLTQTLDLITDGTFYPESHELNLDRIVAMIQQLDEKLSRAPLAQITEQVSASLDYGEPIASTVIGWNDTATQVQLYTFNEITQSVADDLTDHINDPTDAHDASAISVVATGNLASTNVQSGLEELQANIDLYFSPGAFGGSKALQTNGSGKVTESSVTSTELGYLSGVTSAIQSQINATNTNFNLHIIDTLDAHDASAISVVPTGNLSSSDVQSALEELQSDIDGFSGFAPTTAQYVVMALSGSLSGERKLTGTANQVILTDGGANGNATLSTPQDIAAASFVQFGRLSLVDTGAAELRIYEAGGGNYVGFKSPALSGDSTYTLPTGFPASDMVLQSTNLGVLSWTTNTAGAPSGAQYLTLSVDATLTNERVFTPGTGLSAVDSGAGGAYTLTNAGVTSAIAGTGIGVSGATGAVTISNTGVTSLIATANQTTVSGATGAVTIGTVQSIGTGSSPTFTGLTLSSLGLGIVHSSSGGVLSSSLIVNADVDSAAAIVRSKLANGTANHVIINDSGGAFSSEATLAVSRGGTNIASYTTGDLLYATGSTTLSKLAIGASATILTSSGSAPQWQSLSNAGVAANTEAYVTIGNTSGLTSERALTGTSNQITVTDNGAGSTVVLATPQNIHTGASPTFVGLTLTGLSTGVVINASGVLSSEATLAVARGGTNIASYTAGDLIYASGTTTFTKLGIGASATVLTSSGSAPQWQTLTNAGIAPNDAQYLTLATNTVLSNERVFTPGTSLSATDGGAGSTYSLNTIQDIRTSASPTFTGLTLSGLGLGLVHSSSGGVFSSSTLVNADVSASAAIAFSKLAALTSAHILVGSAGNVATDVAVSGDISLTNAGVTAYAGTVPINKGGTNITTYTTGDILYASATNVLSKLAATTDGFVLTLASGVPSWAAGGSGTMAIGGTVTSGTTGSMLYIAAGPVLAQDNASLFYNATLKQLQVGTNGTNIPLNSAATESSFLGTSDSTNAVFVIAANRFSATAAQGATAGFGRGRGTRASPTIVQTSDRLASYYGMGYTGNATVGFQRAGQFNINVDTAGTISTTSMPGMAEIQVTPDGSVTPVTAFQITSKHQINMSPNRLTPTANNDAAIAYMPTYTDNGNFTSNVLYFAPTITASGTVSAARSFMHVGGSVTVTSVNYTAQQSVIMVDMTVTANTAVGTAPAVTLFDSLPTYDWKQILSGGSTYYTFYDHPTFQATSLGNTSTAPPIIASVYSAPILKSTVAATTTMRITARYGIGIEDINYADTTGAVTVDNNTGIYINDFVVGVSGNRTVTTAIGLNSFMKSGTSKYFIRHEGIGGSYAQSVHGGKIRFGDTTDPTQVVEVLGNVYLDNGGTSGELRIREPSAGGSSYAGLKAGALAANAIWTLPDLPGSTQYIQCSSAGVISYTTSTGGTNALLDGTVHTDTLAGTVVRGDVIVGNSTPKWSRLAIGSSGKVLTSDGTDASWQTPATYTLITTKTKPSDESYGALVTGTNMHDDADITSLTMPATGKYVIRGVLWVTCTSATPDFKMDLTAVTSTVNNMNVLVEVHRIGAITDTDYIQLTSSGGSSGIISIGASTVMAIYVDGTVDITTAGSMKLRWAQNTANGTQVTMQRGSYLSIYSI